VSFASSERAHRRRRRDHRPLDKGKLEELATLPKSRPFRRCGLVHQSYVDSAPTRRDGAFSSQRLPGIYLTAARSFRANGTNTSDTSTAGRRLRGATPARLCGTARGSPSAKRGRATFLHDGVDGGVFSVARAKQQPVMLVRSGPVGGCIGACSYARELGIAKLIAFEWAADGEVRRSSRTRAFDTSRLLCRRLRLRFPIHARCWRHRGGWRWRRSMHGSIRRALFPSVRRAPAPIPSRRLRPGRPKPHYGWTSNSGRSTRRRSRRRDVARRSGGPKACANRSARSAWLQGARASTSVIGHHRARRRHDGRRDQQITIERGMDPRESRCLPFGAVAHSMPGLSRAS